MAKISQENLVISFQFYAKKWHKLHTPLFELRAMLNMLTDNGIIYAESGKQYLRENINKSDDSKPDHLTLLTTVKFTIEVRSHKTKTHLTIQILCKNTIKIY